MNRFTEITYKIQQLSAGFSIYFKKISDSVLNRPGKQFAKLVFEFLFLIIILAIIAYTSEFIALYTIRIFNIVDNFFILIIDLFKTFLNFVITITLFHWFGNNRVL